MRSVLGTNTFGVRKAAELGKRKKLDCGVVTKNSQLITWEILKLALQSFSKLGSGNGPLCSFINQSLDAGCPPARKGLDQGLDVCLQLRAVPSKGHQLSTVLAAGIKDFSLKWDAGRCRAMPTTFVYVPDALFLSDLPFKAHGFHVHGCFMISR